MNPVDDISWPDSNLAQPQRYDGTVRRWFLLLLGLVGCSTQPAAHFTQISSSNPTPFVDAFNAAADSTRVLVLLSPT
jgi:hypothetical protein